MKASRYYFFFKEDGLLFNAVTCGLAQVLPENVDLIEKVLENPCENNLSALDTDIKEKLIEGGFLIEDDVDEDTYLKAIFNLRRFATKNFELTILPTLNCNFNCIYCYEHKRNDRMDENARNKIKEQVASLTEIKNLGVLWYGGEPLLFPEIIFDLSDYFIKYCQDKNIGYQASIVTNGYFLNKEMARDLKEIKIKSAQVTLDGPEVVHNIRRPLKNGGGTFERILANILESADVLKIYIRVNIDRGNYTYLPQLLKQLKSAHLEKKVQISLGLVTTISEACRDYEENCLKIKEFSPLELNTMNDLIKEGFAGFYFPKPIEVSCMAVSPQNFVIGPTGELYKCLETVGDEKEIIGSINSISLNNLNFISPNLAKWLSYDPFTVPECKHCEFLPICLGGCPLYHLKQSENYNTGLPCRTWRFSLKDVLKSQVVFNV